MSSAGDQTERSESFIDVADYVKANIEESSSAAYTPTAQGTSNSYIQRERAKFFMQLRQMAATPTPVANALNDPNWSRVLTPRPKSRSSKSSKSSNSSTKSDSLDTSHLIQLVFNAEERQTNELKMLLRTTGDRLEQELHRADAAERRAAFAEERTKISSERIADFISVKHEADLRIVQLGEETKRLRLMIETQHRELERAQDRIAELERQNMRAEYDIKNAKKSAKEFELALQEQRSQDKLNQENRFVDGIVEGRQAGYEIAKKLEREKRKRVYQTAFEAGRNAGFDEGLACGREEERERALDAFDKFLENQGEQYE
ncbi:hypothetical protein Clacol_000823 [Clathrus columnatus]|uniref:Uncharacterized protein n=1 Tax=Clathrus columnatus TaxID=1419009 RepID=A0AAV4ZX90_9AGAM|nr:hypothetical protein Clacol_000823 [Clathrus columnatus]